MFFLQTHAASTNFPQLVTTTKIILLLLLRQLLTPSKRQATTTFMLTSLIKVNNPDIAVSLEHVSLGEIAMDQSSFMYFTELLEDTKSWGKGRERDLAEQKRFGRSLNSVVYRRTEGQLKDDQKDVEDTRPSIPGPSMQLVGRRP